MLPPNAIVFYVDESIYSKVLVAALINAGESVEQVGRVIPFGAKDHEWLSKVGDREWIALTRDQRIRYRTLEKRTLKLHKVGAFTFTGGQATAEQTAKRIVELVPKMKALAVSEPRPFIFTFALVGPLARVRL